MRPSYFLKNKVGHDADGEEGSWAISYGDMITLLLSFFVMFFSTDHQSEDSKKANLILQNYISFIPDGGNPPGESGIARAKLEAFDVKVHQIGDLMLVSFGAKSFFNSGDVELRPEGKAILEDFVKKFLPFSAHYTISVKGFTDRVRVDEGKQRHRKFKDNLELSALRSVSAIRILRAAGIPMSNLEIAGAGELQAIKKIIPAPGTLTPEQIKSYSRTIVIVLRPKKESWL